MKLLPLQSLQRGSETGSDFFPRSQLLWGDSVNHSLWECLSLKSVIQAPLLGFLGLVAVWKLANGSPCHPS